MAATGLSPEFDWLAETGDADDSWFGPGPMLVNLQHWMDRLAATSHRHLVLATYAAAQTSHPHWDKWLADSPNIAHESILDARTPTEQLAAVAHWLDTPTEENKSDAQETVDLTKQLHWYHEEYEDVWFDEPGMWAVESAEHCVLSLTGDPYSSLTLTNLATIAVSCAVNSFRRSLGDSIRAALRSVVDAIADQFAEAG